MSVRIEMARPESAVMVAGLTLELTDEIIRRTGAPLFEMSRSETVARCERYLREGLYHTVCAFEGEHMVGMASLCQSHALYTLGTFGIVQEFYVQPDYRSRGIGKRLLARALQFAREQGWQRLELCTPPLPDFQATLEFYQREGFEVTGGRKMKLDHIQHGMLEGA
jgi:GNAT superfamily N-acetyltransferase